METFKFKNGTRTYRIQFQIVSPPPAAFQKPAHTGDPRPKLKHTVDSIRVVEITEGIGDKAQKRTLNFNRDFPTLGQARTRAGEYAKRIVREQMTPNPGAMSTPAADDQGKLGM
jgi:hypothetical protein